MHSVHLIALTLSIFSTTSICNRSVPIILSSVVKWLKRLSVRARENFTLQVIMFTIKLQTLLCVVLHFQFSVLGGLRSSGEEAAKALFHAKHPLAKLKVKGTKVSVTIENNRNLPLLRSVGKLKSNYF